MHDPLIKPPERSFLERLLPWFFAAAKPPVTTEYGEAILPIDVPDPSGFGSHRYANWTRSRLNVWHADVSFAGKPLQCSSEDGTCDDLR